MQKIGTGFGRVVHMAYLVEDIDAAMASWMQQAGLGPWTCFRHIDLAANLDQREFRLHIHEALAYIGDLQIQLVQSLDDPRQETPYSEFLKARRFGVHHVAFFSGDIDADVARAREQGFERVCRMHDGAGGRYAYCQSSALPDVWIEFLQESPELEQMYADGIAAAADWDGSHPVTDLDFRELGRA